MARRGVHQEMARFLAYGIGAALLLAGCALAPAPAPYGAYYGAYGPAYPEYYGPPVLYGYGCCAGDFRRHEHDHDHDRDRGGFHGAPSAAARVAPPASGSSAPRPASHAPGGAPAAPHHAPSHAPASRERDEHH